MTAIRMPDLRARHDGPHRAQAVRLPDLRVPDVVRDLRRADGVAASTALAVVGAALAWLMPGQSAAHTVGLALVVLGPLGLLATLTLMSAIVPIDETAETVAEPNADDIDERLPALELQHSVRP